jgi:uncharacterized protein YigA (DUF484 family)
LEQELETVRADNQRLHNELGNLQEREERELSQLRSQLETERADHSEIEAELSKLKKNSAPAATLFEKLTPDSATVLSQLARQT